MNVYLTTNLIIWSLWVLYIICVRFVRMSSSLISFISQAHCLLSRQYGTNSLFGASEYFSHAAILTIYLLCTNSRILRLLY